MDNLQSQWNFEWHQWSALFESNFSGELTKVSEHFSNLFLFRAVYFHVNSYFSLRPLLLEVSIAHSPIYWPVCFLTWSFVFVFRTCVFCPSHVYPSVFVYPCVYSGWRLVCSGWAVSVYPVRLVSIGNTRYTTHHTWHHRPIVFRCKTMEEKCMQTLTNTCIRLHTPLPIRRHWRYQLLATQDPSITTRIAETLQQIGAADKPDREKCDTGEPLHDQNTYNNKGG